MKKSHSNLNLRLEIFLKNYERVSGDLDHRLRLSQEQIDCLYEFLNLSKDCEEKTTPIREIVLPIIKFKTFKAPHEKLHQRGAYSFLENYKYYKELPEKESLKYFLKDTIDYDYLNICRFYFHTNKYLESDHAKELLEVIHRGAKNFLDNILSIKITELDTSKKEIFFDLYDFFLNYKKSLNFKAMGTDNYSPKIDFLLTSIEKIYSQEIISTLSREEHEILTDSRIFNHRLLNVSVIDKGYLAPEKCEKLSILIRRKFEDSIPKEVQKESTTVRWENFSFRDYKDYMISYLRDFEPRNSSNSLSPSGLEMIDRGLERIHEQEQRIEHIIKHKSDILTEVENRIRLCEKKLQTSEEFLKLAFEKIILSSNFSKISLLAHMAGFYSVTTEPKINIENLIKTWIQGFFSSFQKYKQPSDLVTLFTLLSDRQEPIVHYLYYQTQLKHLKTILHKLNAEDKKENPAQLLGLLEQKNSLQPENSILEIGSENLKILCWEHIKGFKLRPLLKTYTNLSRLGARNSSSASYD